MALLTYMRAYLIASFIVVLLLCAFFAFACYKIVKNKGYEDDSCFGNAIGGFLLTWIWLIIVLCKPNTNAEIRKESIRRPEKENSAVVSQPVFIISLLVAILLSIAGLVVFFKFSWWGLAIVGAGLIIFAVLYNKI